MTLSSFVKVSGKKGLHTYRRRVPTDLIGQWLNDAREPIREVKKALKTADRSLALKRGAEVNLEFEAKAKNLRLGNIEEAQKTAFEKLEERKWIIQTATHMLKEEGVLPQQQPSLSAGASIEDIKNWEKHLDNAKHTLLDAVQHESMDHEKRQQDYDKGQWNKPSYQEPYKPIDPNNINSVMYDIASGVTPTHSIEPTWKDAVDLYLTENKKKAGRSEYNQKKHETRVCRSTDDLALYLGAGNKMIGYETKLSEFTTIWMRGFGRYLNKTYPHWSNETFNKAVTLVAAPFNTGSDLFELNLKNPFEGLKVEKTAAHITGVPQQDKDRRSFTPEELSQYEQFLRAKPLDIRTIGLFTIWLGLRPMEIGGLTHGELFLDVNIPYIDLKFNHIRRLKTHASVRKLPLTSDATDLMRDYLATQKNKLPNDPIFAKFGRDGGTDPLSPALRNIIRRQMGIDDPRLVPYSTRHTMKDKLRAIRTPEIYQLRITGNKDRNPIAEGYGEGDPMLFIREELERAAKAKEWGIGAEFKT